MEEYFDQNQVNRAANTGKPAAQPASVRTVVSPKKVPKAGLAQIKNLAVKKAMAKTKVDQVIQSVLKKGKGDLSKIKPKTV